MKAINLILLAGCVALAAADIDFDEFGFEEDGSIIDPRVVGGQEAKEGQFPYQVSLRDKLLRQHFCGASLISSRFLLTAAHCTEGLNSKPAFVVAVVGALRRRNDGVTVKLNKITRHSEWNRSKLVNDIALLRTAGEVVFTKSVQPIALPKQNLEGDVVISGWGRHKYPSMSLPNILQYTELRALSYNDCVERFKGQSFSKFVRETMICAVKTKGIGACHGDSGGPLADVTDPANKALVGIVSWGVPCATGLPDVYTRVFSYLDWINENIEKQSYLE